MPRQHACVHAATKTVRRDPGAIAFREAFCSITISLVAITVIVLGCSWLWQSVGAGVFAVLALAVPFSLPAVRVSVYEAMDPAARR
jgi:hypothetical protein